MTPAVAQPRRSALVQEQLQALNTILKNAPPPPPGDFAAELQRQSWETHRAELEEELAQARLLEQTTVTVESRARSASARESVVSALDRFVEMAYGVVARIFHRPSRRRVSPSGGSTTNESASRRR
jgi:hypothetical protein